MFFLNVLEISHLILNIPFNLLIFLVLGVPKYAFISKSCIFITFGFHIGELLELYTFYPLLLFLFPIQDEYSIFLNTKNLSYFYFNFHIFIKLNISIRKLKFWFYVLGLSFFNNVVMGMLCDLCSKKYTL